ncbi:MAG: hypothetical protein ACYCSP_15970 [Acidobacteriaceae bacterium]
MMFNHATKQLTHLVFAGILAIVTSFAMAQTSTAQNPSTPASAASTGKQQIKQDRKQLRADVQQYGKKSPQAKADRKKLRQDRSNQSGG